MAEQRSNGNDQDERVGGYGGSTGGQDPRPQREEQDDTGAGGRNGPVSSPMDADEALGNRTGGYGGNPNTATEQPDGSPGSS